MSIEVVFPHPRDLPAMFAPLHRGGGDPAFHRDEQGIWIVGSGPAGPVTQRLSQRPDAVLVSLWGDGAAWAAEQVDGLLGGIDDAAGFTPQHGLLERQWRRYHQTLRVPRSLLTWQVALAAVLEQRVTGAEAHGAWRGLLTEYGSPAPGPVPDSMRVPPGPAEVLLVPSWDWRRYGVDRQRVSAIREVARAHHLLVRAQAMPPAQGRDLLTRIPGVGPWTAAQISAVALGDADAVGVGDYHLARNVVYALTGRTDGTDEQMLDLLGVYAGHRHRAVRLIELAGVQPPRRGPRMRLPGPRQARPRGPVG